MRIIYAYEASGIKFQELEIEVPSHIIESKKMLPRDEVLSLLAKEKVRVSQSSVLSYYNESTGLFISAEKGIPVTNTVQLLIRNGVALDNLDIHTRISKLEDEILKIQAKLDNRAIEAGPSSLFKKTDSLFYYSKDIEIDLAMLFAAPIVVEKGGETSALNDPSLEFESFKRSLIGHLENKNVGLNVKIDCGTVDTLVETLYSKPKILLLYCHGHHTASEGFIVGLENSALGVLEEVSATRLRNIVRTSALYQDMIIVYSNLAQEIGRLFLDAGFNCVVCIQASNSDTDIAESFFVSELIRNLLKGVSIEAAYDSAEAATQEKYTDEIQTCCCAHLHKTSCAWVKILESSTSYDAHLAHVPTCNCAVRNESTSLHSTECSWALSFLDEYNDTKFASEYELRMRKWHICCCSPEMDHSKLKFHLMISDERVKDQVLYDTSLRSAIEIQTGYSQHLKPPYSPRLTVGRRTEMHALITHLKSCKCVQLNGQTGVGKTLLAKRVAQYAYERNMFRDGVAYLDYRGKTDILFAYRLISSALQIPSIKTKEELCNEIKNLRVLFVIDNIEFFLKESRELILETFRFFLNNTSEPKFLILSENSIPVPNSYNITLNPLTEKEAAELLLKLSSSLSKPDFRKPKQLIKKLIEEDKIMSCIGTLPSSIHQVATQLKYKTINEILRDYADIQRIDSTPNEKNIEICLKNLEIKVPGAIEFFKLLSCLPSCFLEINMKFITADLSVDYKKILDILIHDKNPRISNTWLIHKEKNFYAMSNSVSPMLFSKTGIKASYASQCVLHLGAFARAVLNDFLKQGTEESGKPYLAFNYRGSMMFLNAGINVGIWKVEFETSASMQAELEEVTQDIEDYITKFEGNYWYFIDENRFFSEFDENSIGEELRRGLKEMVVCFASILAINGKHSDALEILKRGIACFHRMNNDEIEAVLKLMLSSQLAYADKDHEQAYSKLLEAEETFKQVNSSEGLGEVYLLKALLNKRMQNSRAQSESIAVLSSRDYERYLNESILHFTKINNTLGLSRAQFLKYKWKIDSGKADLEIADHLLTCQKTFEQHKFYSWQERVHIYLSDCFLQLKEYFKSKDHLVKAQTIANKIKDYYQSGIITQKITQTYELIRKKNKNNFSVLRAAPLVDKDEYNNVIRIGPPFRCPSEYKSKLTHILSKSSCSICVRFGVLTKELLKEHLFAGCKVLQISSKVPNNEYINVEDDEFVNDVLTIEDIVHLVGENLSDYGLDLLILAMPYSDLLAEKIKERLQVPNVIGFDLPRFPIQGDSINLYNLYEQSIEDFNLEFFEQLIHSNDIQASFQSAKNFIQAEIAERLEDELLKYLTDEFISLAGKGPVLISDSNSPNKLDCLIPRSPDSTLIDMSNARAPFNLPKLSSYFIGRNMEMHNVVKALKRFQCVHLIGCEGIGKTEFLHHLGYFLSFRNYFHDGIFYIDVQGKSSVEEINFKLQEFGLLSLTQDNLIKKAMAGKKLLLLVDNCDAMIKNSENTFFRLYHLLIKECGIYILFSSNLQLKDTHLTIEQIPLRPMSTSESLCLFQLKLYQSYTDAPSSPVTRSSFKTVLDKVNKNCQGIPKKIVYWTNRFLTDDYENIALDLNLDRVINTTSEPDSPSGYKLPTLSLKRSNTRDERLDRFQEWDQPTNSNPRVNFQYSNRKSIESIPSSSDSPFLLSHKLQKKYKVTIDSSPRDLK